MKEDPINFPDLIEDDSLPPHLKLKKHLDENGIKYAWVANRLGVVKSWMSNVFSGLTKLNDEHISKLEDLLKIKLR